MIFYRLCVVLGVVVDIVLFNVVLFGVFGS